MPGVEVTTLDILKAYRDIFYPAQGLFPNGLKSFLEYPCARQVFLNTTVAFLGGSCVGFIYYNNLKKSITRGGILSMAAVYFVTSVTCLREESKKTISITELGKDYREISQAKLKSVSKNKDSMDS